MNSLVTETGIAYQVSGDGPALMLISGLGGHASFWDTVRDGLANEFKVIAFDHPGVGKSLPVVEHSIKAIAQAALDVMDGAGIQKATVVGHSTGSLVAQTLALDARERCDKLVLSGGWAKVDRRFRDLFLLRRHVLDQLGSRAHAVMSALFSYPNGLYNDTMASETSPDFDPHKASDAQTVVQRIDMLLNYSRIDDLRSLSIETVAIGAEDDMVVPVGHTHELASLISGARCVVTTGGHFFPKTNTEPYVDILKQLMRPL